MKAQNALIVLALLAGLAAALVIQKPMHRREFKMWTDPGFWKLQAERILP